jgi:hypothetical protein
MKKLQSTDYVLLDRHTGELVRFADSGEIIVYGNIAEALSDARGASNVQVAIRCTELSYEHTKELIEQLNPNLADRATAADIFIATVIWLSKMLMASMCLLVLISFIRVIFNGDKFHWGILCGCIATMVWFATLMVMVGYYETKKYKN